MEGIGRRAALAAMLAPRVTAHIGASESGTYPAGIFEALSASATVLYPVNPGRASVFGRPCFPSVAELPERPDLAVVTIPAARVPGALEDCARGGVAAAVVVSSGFSEAGADGARLQAALAPLRDRILILGPNCAGFANLRDGITAARLYAERIPGGVSLVSQSGALMMALHGSFAARGAGMRYLVSVGNQEDLALEDILEHCAADPATTVAAAFVEGVRDGPRFAAALEAGLRAGKPVVVLKAGRSDEGRRLAATHTAAVAGSSRVFEAVCRQHGAILVDDAAQLADTASLWELSGGRLTERIAWLAQSGGVGALLGDQAAAAGFPPQPPSAALEKAARGADLLPADRPLLNPVDLGGDRLRGRALEAAAEPFAADPQTDVLAFLFAKNPNREVEAETAEAVASVRSRFGKPVFVVWVGGDAPPPEGRTSAVRLLARAGIPVFLQPGDAVRAVARLLSWKRFRRAKTGAEGGAPC